MARALGPAGWQSTAEALARHLLMSASLLAASSHAEAAGTPWSLWEASHPICEARRSDVGRPRRSDHHGGITEKRGCERLSRTTDVPWNPAHFLFPRLKMLCFRP